MPGHKQGRGASAALAQSLGVALSIDLTEVDGLDDLHAPAGVIEEAQRLAAEAAGGRQSFFLVNGTTAGILALLLAVAGEGVAGEGRTVLIPRNAHRSVTAGLILSGARPAYLRPCYDADLDLALGIAPSTVAEALARHPDACALMLINPTFHGFAPSVEEITRICGNIPVLVDEAHGAHFAFHPGFPVSALRAGAAATVQSWHKTAGSLTQSSMLHLGQGIEAGRVAAMLRLVQSTSPSYLLMVSLDLARREMALSGRQTLDRALSLATEARRRIEALPGLRCPGPDMVGRPGVAAFDPTKLLIDTRDTGLSGFQVSEYLMRQGIALESAGSGYVLAMVTIGDTPETIAAIIKALSDLPRQGGLRGFDGHRLSGTESGVRSSVPRPLGEPPIPPQAMTPRQAYLSPKEPVALERARGRISGEMVAPYPPGIPVLCPGEVIDEQALDYLLMLRSRGAHLQGPEDPMLATVAVVKE